MNSENDLADTSGSLETSSKSSMLTLIYTNPWNLGSVPAGRWCVIHRLDSRPKACGTHLPSLTGPWAAIDHCTSHSQHGVPRTGTPWSHGSAKTLEHFLNILESDKKLQWLGDLRSDMTESLREAVNLLASEEWESRIGGDFIAAMQGELAKEQERTSPLIAYMAWQPEVLVVSTRDDDDPCAIHSVLGNSCDQPIPSKSDQETYIQHAACHKDNGERLSTGGMPCAASS